ncbi:MAG TPA: hypothetical protein VLC46_24530 [Thermoanaerobaculia bacterium]|jgi:hypothetical protein|nr:hypothetical protein [Thermoanaerobaculia bacterium]
MKTTRIVLLIHVALFAGVTTLGAATRPTFQPSGSGDAGIGRYVVTLTEGAGVEDPVALRQELAVLYGAKLDANASSDIRRFAVTMPPARAQLLSADPLVSEVAEAPLTTTGSAPGTPTVASALVSTATAEFLGVGRVYGTIRGLIRLVRGDPEAVQQSGERFFKKAPKGSENFRVEKQADGTTKYSYDTPGKVPGSKAVYEKLVDKSGNAVAVTKTTVSPQGEVVHVKDKLVP